MSEPLRVPEPGDADAAPADAHVPVEFPSAENAAPVEPDDLTVEELRRRAREQAEAEFAVAAVMRREDEKAAKLAIVEGRVRRESPVRMLLLGALLLFNAYLWTNAPGWLEYRTPRTPPLDYYEASWRIAVYMQHQRVEEFRRERGKLPLVARRAGPPVKGVTYTPLTSDMYELRAGNHYRQIIYRSTDSLRVFMGRAMLQMGLIAGGAR
jgi:hypothetical protein